MLSQTLLLTLAGVAAASILPGHLEARQGEDTTACMAAISSAFAGAPTQPAAIVSYFATQTETDACKITVPSSLEGVYASYTSAAASFFAERGAAITAAVSKCPSLADATEGLNAPTCTDTSSSGSGSNNNNNNNNSGSGKPNAGHRETGFAGAAIAAAGFLAIVAAL
ncbi:hypothetical protein C8A01DRAFT_20623 [Parachaetomium inaequale]|uniref:Infection structure specific protein n=1 Tax=Parachaetomium inaequale TaxID=2588326 RepID=A0AAN6P5R9_9PEZI|nr:hypothetical protein C8A01DRAFT_20623 [Parachaetomium inaequale]